MAELSRFFRQIFQDVNGGYSSKRTIAILAFIFLLICGTVNLVWAITITEFIFEGFTWIVIGGLGISIGEHFATVMKAKTDKISG